MTESEKRETEFPLTVSEAGWLYDMLLYQYASRDHPYYLYSSSLLERMRRFLVRHDYEFKRY